MQMCVNTLYVLYKLSFLFLMHKLCRLSILCVCVLPSGRILFTQKTQARTNATERNNKNKKKERKKGGRHGSNAALHLIMSQKTKERGLATRSNRRGMKRKKKIEALWLKGKQEVRWWKKKNIISRGRWKRLHSGRWRGRDAERGRKITLMRRKSWLRQASRDRRPRRTQSSISPSYERNTQCDDGGGDGDGEGQRVKKIQQVWSRFLKKEENRWVVEESEAERKESKGKPETRGMWISERDVQVAGSRGKKKGREKERR